MPQVHFAVARQVQMHLQAISWRQVNPQGPVPGERGFHSAAYDPESNSMVVLWGGLLLSVASVSVFCIFKYSQVFSYQDESKAKLIASTKVWPSV